MSWQNSGNVALILPKYQKAKTVGIAYLLNRQRDKVTE